MTVSRNRPLTRDRQPKTKAGPSKSVGLAIIHTGTGHTYCSCGWQFFHPREKILGDRSQSHINRKHGGQGVWL